VADYLLGLPLKMFLPKHGVTHVTVIGWVARAGCFRLRNKIASTRRVT
jgi:hypothetical protein